MLRCAKSDGEGPSQVLASWERIRVALHRDVIQLRQTNAAPSPQSKAVDAQPGAQPLYGPSQAQLTQHLAEATPVTNAMPNSVEGPKSKPRTKPGRKPDTDPKEDKRIADGWSSGQYKTFADMEREMGLCKGAARRAIDRHRKRK